MKLIFQRSSGEEITLHSEIRDMNHALNEIQKFIDKCNEKNKRKFQMFYHRLWVENGRLEIDVGSHTEFFYIEDFTKEFREWLIERKLLNE